MTATIAALAAARDVVFISKATPGDDDFVLWLAPRLEAAGYVVFADIISLTAGDRWRKVITGVLQDKAAKMLLCCSDATLSRDNVQEEVGIALDLAKSIPDPRFLIPLRLASYKKILGIGEIQYIDFVRGWADGLERLLDHLQRQRVPTRAGGAKISEHWELYRKRRSVEILRAPERLTSNWLRVSESPDRVWLHRPRGAFDAQAMDRALARASYPSYIFERSILTFAGAAEIGETLSSVGSVETIDEFDPLALASQGAARHNISSRDASNVLHSMFRQAWNAFCISKGLLRYQYSGASVGFHVTRDQLKLGGRRAWGAQGERRSAALRNAVKGHVWQYGVTALPSLWPFFHFKLKSRVLFAPLEAEEGGEPYEKTAKQHRLRRTISKGWRNKQWYGRMMAYLELLSEGSAFLKLPLAQDSFLTVEASPILFTSPVSTALPNVQEDDDEEIDDSTLGRPATEEADDD